MAGAYTWGQDGSVYFHECEHAVRRPGREPIQQFITHNGGEFECRPHVNTAPTEVVWVW
jgi:hypothetical protein